MPSMTSTFANRYAPTAPSMFGASGDVAPWFSIGADNHLSGIRHVPTGAERRFEEHEHLYLEGQRPSVFYQVLEGAVCLYTLLTDGRRQVTSFVYPGELIGLDCPAVHYDSAQALCTTRVRTLTLHSLERLLSDDPAFVKAVLRCVSGELADSRQRMLWLGQMTATERVAGFLMNLAEHHGAPESGGRRVWLPMMRADIADHLGLKVETVSRQFTRLRVARVIRLVSLREVEILDPVRLAEMANRDTVTGQTDATPEPATAAA